MGVTENKKIVESFYEAANRGDLETSFALIADDITWTNMGSTRLSGTFRGKDDLMDRLLGPLFGQLKGGIATTIHRLIGEADYVVALTSGRAETAEGRPYNNHYCQIMRIREGQIVEVTEYLDTELLTSAFGPAPGS